MLLINSKRSEFIVGRYFILVCLAISLMAHFLVLFVIFAKHQDVSGGGYKNSKFMKLDVFMLGHDVEIIGNKKGLTTDIKKTQTQKNEDGYKVKTKQTKKEKNKIKQQSSMEKGVGKGEKRFVVSKGEGGVSSQGGGKADEFLSKYLYILQRHLQKNLIYPKKAKLLRRQGTVVLEIAIKKNGKIKKNSLKVIKNSKHRILDEGAIKTVLENTPLPKPPFDGMKIEIPINFIISE